MTLTNRSATFVASLARAKATVGDSAGARTLLRELETRAREVYVPSYELARVHTALGEHDRALDLLEHAHAERSHSMVFLGLDPQLRLLHGELRFERLITRVDAARRTSPSR